MIEIVAVIIAFIDLILAVYLVRAVGMDVLVRKKISKIEYLIAILSAIAFIFSLRFLSFEGVFLTLALLAMVIYVYMIKIKYKL